MNLSQIEPLLNQKFLVRATDQLTVELTLSGVERLRTYSPPGGTVFRSEPFALLFHGPRETLLPQRSYRLEQEVLGAVEIFLVPLGPDAVGQRYEAIYN